MLLGGFKSNSNVKVWIANWWIFYLGVVLRASIGAKSSFYVIDSSKASQPMSMALFK